MSKDAMLAINEDVARRDPTEEELASPLFNAIWDVIKKWDISTDENHELYSGATGTDVCVIMDKVLDTEIPGYYKTAGSAITNQPATLKSLLNG